MSETNDGIAEPKEAVTLTRKVLDLHNASILSDTDAMNIIGVVATAGPGLTSKEVLRLTNELLAIERGAGIEAIRRASLPTDLYDRLSAISTSLADWLTDNTEETFEEEDDVDEARGTIENMLDGSSEISCGDLREALDRLKSRDHHELAWDIQNLERVIASYPQYEPTVGEVAAPKI